MSSMSTSERDTMMRMRVLSMVPAPCQNIVMCHFIQGSARMLAAMTSTPTFSLTAPWSTQEIAVVPSWPCEAALQSRQACPWCISLWTEKERKTQIRGLEQYLHNLLLKDIQFFFHTAVDVTFKRAPLCFYWTEDQEYESQGSIMVTIQTHGIVGYSCYQHPEWH